MPLTRVCTLFVLLLVSQIECGRTGGGSRTSGSSSHHSTSHSSPSHTSSHTTFGGGSHSSPSHTSFGSGSSSHPSTFGSGTHSTHTGPSATHLPSSFGSGTHSSPPISHTGPSAPHLPPTFGSGTHSSPPISHTGPSAPHLPPTFGSGTHSSPPVASAPHLPSGHVGPSAPNLPGYTVTGGTGFIPHSSGGTKPIGFDHVNQQAQNSKPSGPPSGGIGFDHHQQTHNTPLNSGKPPPLNPLQNGPPGYTVTGGTPIGPKPGGIGFDHVNQQVHNAPPGYTVTGGAPLPGKPTGSIGFDHVNQQAHNNVNPGRPVTPPSTGGFITPQHTNQVHSAPNAPYPQGYPTSRPGIGFDHVNQQVHHNTPTYYQPYRPQTVVQPGGYVHYQPPVQLQYTPPVTIHHTTTHIVPVYQPSVIQTYSSGGGLLSHGGAFLGGYLVGRLTSPSYGYGYHSHNGYQNTHITNNYYNNDNNYYNGNSGTSGVNTGTSGVNNGPSGSTNSYYSIHHHYQNREQVPPKFSVPGEDLTQCQANTTDQLCVPNTNAFCLRNGTIMCTTPSLLTTPCGGNTTDSCVYSRIDCNGSPACNQTANQTYIDFYLPCISNVTYLDNKVVDSTAYKAQGSYELCVTAIAHPRKLESPVVSVANLFVEFGKWSLEQIGDIHNKANTRKR